MQFKDYTVLADARTILTRLMEDLLAQTGKQYFRKFIVKDDDIQFCCPIHKQGLERNPSCGMTTQERRKSDGTVIEAGVVHCFTCGYTAPLNELISYLFGKNDGGLFGSKWLAQNFSAVAIENRRALKLDLSRSSKKVKTNYVTEEELDRYRFIHPYMYKRGLTDELIELYDVGYDPKFKLKPDSNPFSCITFPVRDVNGKTLFIARRAIDFKLYHYPENVEKPLYGIYELKSFDDLIICESILNAITATKYGRNAIALLGTGTKEQYAEINKLPCRKIITAFDGDEAGHKATQRFKAAITSKIIKSLKIPEGKDVNDLSLDEFNNLQEIF